MLPVLHVYPPPPPSQSTTPIPHSMQCSPQTPTQASYTSAHHHRPQAPTSSHTVIRHPSPQTPTQPPRPWLRRPQTHTWSLHAPLHHLSPQTPAQISRTTSDSPPAVTPTADTQWAVAIRSSKSVRRRLSDAEDPFAAVHVSGEDQQLGHKVQAEVGNFITSHCRC